MLLACGLFFWGYTTYLSDKYEKPEGTSDQASATATTLPQNSQTTGEVNSETTTAAANDANGDVEPEVKQPAIKRLSVEELTFETDLSIYEFNQDLSAFSSIKLKNYTENSNHNEPVELLDGPFVLQATTDVVGTRGRKGFHAERDGRSITFRRQDGAWEIAQKFTFPEKETKHYGIEVQTTYKNLGKTSQELNAGVLTKTVVVPPESGGGFLPGFNYERKTVVLGVGGDREYEDTESYCDDFDGEPALTGRNAKIDYIGYDDHYFLKALLPKDDKLSYSITKAIENHPGDGCPVVATVYQPQGLVEPGTTITLNHRAYFGPKKTDALVAFQDELKSSLYLGWFGAIARPLLWAVKGVYNLLGNYGLAIIIITVILKILFFPLTRAAQVSMKKMQKLQPQMNAIREKHKNDRQKQQQEIMKFMSEHKINPAKGCLPILPQIPVFIAFYNVLSNAIELRHAPFFGWIQDLSQSDPYLITPILLGVGMFAQQKLTPHPGMDKNQERIMMMMPLIFTVMMVSLPAGMVLYMLVNTIVSIVQQQWLNKSLA